MDMHAEPAGFGDGSQLHGQSLVDEHGEAVGTVTDVVFDDMRSQPTFAVVAIGLLKSEHLVPLAGAYLSEGGKLVVGCPKTTVKRSPRVGPDHNVSDELRRKVVEHYDVAA